MARRINSSVQTMRLFMVFLGHPEEWRYGYQISRETGLKSGTLYPLLMKLEEQGFLETAWTPPERPGRPPRHLYRLTAEGLATALQCEDSAGTYSQSGGEPVLETGWGDGPA